MKYNFDQIPNRKISHCRKWDDSILKNKFGVNESAIPLDLADMDFECSTSIKKALVDRANLGDFGYTFCYDDFYDAVIQWNRRKFSVELKKDWIRLTFGTCGTLHYIVQCFCNPGDSVLINTPAYAPFAEAVKAGDCNLVASPLLIRENRYYFDFKDMRDKIQKHHIKAFILCSPQNPSGRIWSKDELNEICQLCLGNDVLLICDEIHRDITFKKFTSIYNSHPEIIEKSILCLSPNKGFNLGGLKSSYIVIKNKDIREKFYDYLQKVYITSPHVFAVPAIVAAYNESEEWLNEVTKYIYQNLQLVYEWFKEKMPLAKVMEVEAGYLVWIDMKDIFANEHDMKKFFQQCNLTMVPGSYFVSNGEGWVRINVATSKTILLEALNRIEKGLQKYLK